MRGLCPQTVRRKGLLNGELGLASARLASSAPHASATARRVVQLLLRHKLVDRAVRAEGLAVRGACHPPLHLRDDQIWINDQPDPTGPLL